MVTLDESQSEVVLTVFADVNFEDLMSFDKILVPILSIGAANIKKTKKKAVFVFVSLFGIRSGVAYTLLI